MRRLEAETTTVIQKLGDEIKYCKQWPTHEHYAERAKQLDEGILKLKNRAWDWKLSFCRKFEDRGIDVVLTGSLGALVPMPGEGLTDIYASVVSAGIEIKPEVGDDYPAVLRQMRANHSNVLFTQNYTGVGATEEQFVRTFGTADIRVIFRRDVDAVAKSG